MSGYLYFTKLGVLEIDSIGEELESAGHAFHNTSEWVETYEGFSC